MSKKLKSKSEIEEIVLDILELALTPLWIVKDTYEELKKRREDRLINMDKPHRSNEHRTVEKRARKLK